MEPPVETKTSVAARLGEIVDARRARLYAVQQDIDRWSTLDRTLDELAEVQGSLRAKSSLPGELQEVLRTLDIAPMRLQVVQALDALRVAETRFARDTINVGVTGRMRVGKSTLLQSISGLGDEQLPTGSGEPVTATRIRVVHGPATRALVTFHNETSYLEEVVGPYFTQLGVASRPTRLEDFQRWTDFGVSDVHSDQELLKRLKKMQAAIPSYEADLRDPQRERVIEVDELRPYVAYPLGDDEDRLGDAVRRNYLAVRDVRVETPFPHVAVDRLGVVDMVGLGEVAPQTQEHHVDGLRDTVDIVLLVKRAAESLAPWSDDDTRVVDLMDEARGGVRSRRDFLAVVGNVAPGDPENLVTTLRRGVPEADADGRQFLTLLANAADREDVADNVVWPLLEHLAERLPAMDGDVLTVARENTAAIAGLLARELGDVQRTLTDMRITSGSSVELLDHATETLRESVTAGLVDLVARLREVAENDPSDAQYIAQVNAAHAKVKTWIDGGFDEGRESWERKALDRMRVAANSSAWIGPALNGVRVHISRQFADVDHALRLRVEELQRDVADVLLPHLEGMIEPSLEGAAALAAWREALSYAAEPCPTLSAALDSLVSLRLEYRTHIHPRIRSELNHLNLQVQDPETGRPTDQVVVPISEAGAEEAFRAVSELAEMAIHRVRKGLVREAGTPALVLFAVVEQFEDELIRSKSSEDEFKRMARSYRDEIWPGVYSGIDAQNAHVARFQRALHKAKEVVESYVPAR